jgi:hypothetical protein
MNAFKAEFSNGYALHPIILAYRKTESFDSPLVLVIGREPNFEGEIENTVGPYDFDHRDGRKCTFWNRSYGLLARVGGSTSTSAFKGMCRSRLAAPLIYADSLRICLKNSTPKKRERRARETSENIEQHARDVFSHKIIARVSLVLICLLTPKQLQTNSGPSWYKIATDKIKSICVHRSLLCKELPYLSRNVSVETLAASLGPEVCQVLRDTYTFYT